MEAMGPNECNSLTSRSKENAINKKWRAAIADQAAQSPSRYCNYLFKYILCDSFFSLEKKKLCN